MVLCLRPVRSAPRQWLFTRTFSNSTRLNRGADWGGGGNHKKRKTHQASDPFQNEKNAQSRSEHDFNTHSSFQAFLDSSDRVMDRPRSGGTDWNIAGVDLGPGRRSREYGNQSLPLPPIKLSNQRISKKLRRAESTKNKKASQFDKYSTRAENLRNAPFNTTLRQNPYAFALASPVRMCQMTGIRIPSACLIETTITTDARSEKPMLSPASLAVASIAKKKNPSKYSPEESAAVKSIEDAKGLDATGAASYLTAQRAAVEYLCARNNRWQSQLNLRMRESLRLQGTSLDDVIWRDDMPDYIVELLKQVIINKLRPILKNKKTRDRPGLVCSLPDSDSLSWLNRVSDASCVLRLVPEDRPHDILDKADLQIEEEVPIEDREEGWIFEERKKKLPLVDLKPMAPPEQSLHLRFPTVPYRMRRVPLYDLSHLLGPTSVEKLVENTIFNESKYAVLRMDFSTVMLQAWLLQLMAYANESIGGDIVSTQLPVSTQTLGNEFRNRPRQIERDHDSDLRATTYSFAKI